MDASGFGVRRLDAVFGRRGLTRLSAKPATWSSPSSRLTKKRRRAAALHISRSSVRCWLIAMLAMLAWARTSSAAQTTFIPAAQRTMPNLESNIERPLRYRPDGEDFVIVNGAEFFNRPLYGGNTAFRCDAGDRPEFTLYLPGRGGNLRIGIRSANGSKWLFEASKVVARYRPGSMIYEISDPVLGTGRITLSVLALDQTEGLVVRVEATEIPAGMELVWAYGGVSGQRGARDGDIGTERMPISEYFQLKPEFCQDNAIALEAGAFTLRSKPATIRGTVPRGANQFIADANQWSSFDALAAAAKSGAPALPVVIGRVALVADAPLYLALQRLPSGESQADDLATYREVSSDRTAVKTPPAPAPSLLAPAFTTDELPRLFDEAEAHFRSVRERVKIETPDLFLNAAVGALNVGIDAVWDESQHAVMHGAIAWRTKLLGWRGPYATDAFGWHDRARQNISYWITRQNTDSVPEKLPPPDENANLARSEVALHSNGDLSNSHYDMNLVFIDGVFRHLRWTGDVEFARQLWPVIERHLAWERRLFRREFGSDKLPLYEAYAAIWASDDLEYHGGGVAHASAYNAFHNRMAAQVARLIGKDSAPYEREAELIARGMRQQLWLADRGWYAEFKDILGRQLVHPSAAVWSFYHTVDSEVMTPFEAWQMTRYIDTQIPHIPVRGPGVPDDQRYEILSTTNWMPYAWSINNVVMGEVVHTALGYWQAGRADEAYRLMKSAVLGAMYLGISPGNVGTMSYLDVYRRESQRDFADGGGVLARALIEGLFGVRPDVLAGELRVAPGFPVAWDHATLLHPDVGVSFQRRGKVDTYEIHSRFPVAMALRLELVASREGVAGVTVNGQPAAWNMIEAAIGEPRIEILAAAAASQNVVVTWKERLSSTPLAEQKVTHGSDLIVPLPAGEVLSWSDPQNAFGTITVAGIADPGPASARPAASQKSAGHELHLTAIGRTGHRTLFVHLKNGDLSWWEPVAIEISDAAPPATIAPEIRGKLEVVDLSLLFNDRVTQIFKNEYRSPRSPYVSLAIPKQGVGAWAGAVNATAEIDDTGLRAVAKANGGRFVLPNGISFATPGEPDARNILFTSQWDNYPRDAHVPLTGSARSVHLLMAGSTNWMQSHLDNGEVVVTYTDGTTARLALQNPTNWWPIEQDYFIDDYQFRRPEPIPTRVDLKTGEVRTMAIESFKGRAAKAIPGGAATVLELPLDPTKTLQLLTVRTLANEVVIGLMAVTLERGGR